MSSRTVRQVTATDITAVAAALGRAFFEDPVLSWIFPNRRHRTAGIAGFFAAQARHIHLPNGGCELLTDGTDVLGAALWEPPNAWRAPIRRELRALPAHLRTLRHRAPRALGVEAKLVAAHPAEPHWYLAILGTDTAAQGSGVGGELLRSRLARCDADGAPAYLESSNPANVPYYERFGFRVTGEITLSGGGPSLAAMWRDPAV